MTSDEAIAICVRLQTALMALTAARDEYRSRPAPAALSIAIDSTRRIQRELVKAHDLPIPEHVAAL